MRCQHLGALTRGAVMCALRREKGREGKATGRKETKPQATKCHRPPPGAAGRGPRRNQPGRHRDSGLLASRSVHASAPAAVATRGVLLCLPSD